MSNDTLEEVGLPTPAESEAVNLTEQNTPEGTAPDGVVEKTQEEPAKTFTQAEVDAMVQKAKLKAARSESRRLESQLRQQQEAKALQAPSREEFRDEQTYQNAQIEHLVEIKAQEKLAERQRQQEQERLSETFLEKAEKASDKYADFNEVVGNPTLAINTHMAEYISESDYGPDIAYFLGKNPAKAAGIANMSPIRAARELSKIESEMASKPQAKPSKAPEPIAPVGSRSKSSSSSSPSDDDDIETWMKKEWARRQRR